LLLQVTIHDGAKAAYLVSGSTWVGFDLPQTIYMKILAARQLGLGGLMVRCAR
jgi:chitinase